MALQREEMRRNNEHQEDQAKQLKEAAKISSENLKMQKEIYFRELIHLKMKSLSDALLAVSSRYKVSYDTNIVGWDDYGNALQDRFIIRFKFPNEVRENSYIENLMFVSNELKEYLDKYEELRGKDLITELELDDQTTADFSYIVESAKHIKQKFGEALLEPKDNVYFPEFIFFYDFFDRISTFYDLYVSFLDKNNNS